ncbi:MAG: helix-turn-helix transcriptional regulator, partial [Synergistaceae bacterium]|nr:helix-turn-helix transcriptional regulator [Synergistaceae bacterium]
LFAWMQSVFLTPFLFSPSTGTGGERTDFIVFFLAVHALTYFVRAWSAWENLLFPSRRVLLIIGAGMMLALPLFSGLKPFLPQALDLPSAAAGLLLSASGSALLIGRWSELLSTLESEDAALVFGLSPLAAALLTFLSSPLNPFFFLAAAPLLTASLLFFLEREEPDKESSASDDSAEMPLWRVGLFLFCFYGANGLLMSLFPELFPSPFPQGDKLANWAGIFSAMGVAAIFRYYPRANLSNFYRGAFPFLAFSLFLFSFSPFRYISRLFLEGGLAFLDLYAWLLLFFLASHAGRRRTSVINGGLFLIVLASAGSHLHLLLREVMGFWPGKSTLTTLMFLLLLFLLLLIALWDGRGLLLQWSGDTSAGEPGKRESKPSGESMALPAQKDEMEEEMTCRMRLLPYNLTRQETEIALLLLKGNNDSSICSSLFIARNTLKYHLRNIYRKMEIANRTELKKEILQSFPSENPLPDTSA